MCLHPITVPNPNYNRSAYAMQGDYLVNLPVELYSSERYISVPCCICADCRASYYSSILQRGIVESLSSYMFFITLTYDNKHIPSIILPNGNEVFFADYIHIQLMFKRFRDSNILDRPFRYLVCSEYGDTSHRPHFHILLFVSRLSSDTPNVPYFIERIIFDNLGNFFAVNVGTRKHPIYQKLFTYAIRFTSKGIQSNYFVKYVEVDDPLHRNNLFDTTTLVKTIRYVLGYVNKGSSFDDSILQQLDSIHDDILQKKLKRLLRSRVRYSKGFGLGFDEFEKLMMRPTYVKTSYFNYLYNQEFIPDISAVNDFLARADYRKYKSQKDFVTHLSEDDTKIYCYLMRSFPNYITILHFRYWSIRRNDTISYFYEFFIVYAYKKPKMSVSSEIVSVYDFIRRGIDNGIKHKVPYLCFPVVSENRYISLCKFYRERFTTYDDTLRMFQACGVRNFDEWKRLFLSTIDTYKLSVANSKKLTHEVDLIQKNCLSNNPISLLYDYFYSKRPKNT